MPALNQMLRDNRLIINIIIIIYLFNFEYFINAFVIHIMDPNSNQIMLLCSKKNTIYNCFVF